MIYRGGGGGGGGGGEGLEKWTMARVFIYFCAAGRPF